VTGNTDIWIYKNFKKGARLWNTLASQSLCPAHLPTDIGITCSKFHSDDLKTVGGVWDTKFHQTDKPSDWPSADSGIPTPYFM